MNALRVFIKDGKAQITCPGCHGVKNVPIGSDHDKTLLKVKCPCGAVFAVQLEFRKKLRKEKDLEGHFHKLLHHHDHKAGLSTIASGRGTYYCKVKNISLDGAGLLIFGNHGLKSGDRILLEFILDDSSRTKLEKSALVRVVREDYIGCEFEDKEDRKLGFYLLS